MAKTVKIDLRDHAGVPAGGAGMRRDRVTVWAPTFRPATDGDWTVGPQPVEYFFEDGLVSIPNVDAGPLVVRFDVDQMDGVDTFTVTVPAGDGVISMRELLADQYEYAPVVITEARRVLAEARVLLEQSQDSASASKSSQDAAAGSASEAASSATAAKAAQSAAASSASAAAASQGQAKESATVAQNAASSTVESVRSEFNASVQAAAKSANDASKSQEAAAGSASEAASSATAAKAAQSAAASSASAAAASQGQAASSASEAKTSETNAQDSAAAAAGSATEAAAHADRAEKAADSNELRDEITKQIADLVDGAPEDLDTIREVSEYAQANRDVTDQLNAAIGNKANKAHTHTTAQVTGLDSALAGKASTQALADGLAGKADTGHKHSWSEINNKPSTFPPSTHTHTVSQIANLDNGFANVSISTSANRYAVVKRDSSGNIEVPLTPDSGGAATSKAYVDAQDLKIDSLGSGVDLNTITTTGVYHQNMNVNAASGKNYPIDQAGLLEVFNPDASMTYQRYTNYGNTNKVFTRGLYNNQWSAWKELSTSGHTHAKGELEGDDAEKPWDVFLPENRGKLVRYGSGGGLYSYADNSSAPQAVMPKSWIEGKIAGKADKSYVDGIQVRTTNLETNQEDLAYDLKLKANKSDVLTSKVVSSMPTNPVAGTIYYVTGA